MGTTLHIETALYAEQLPRDCIRDCSAIGQVSPAVTFWRRRLQLTVNRQRAIACLVKFGAWSLQELTETDDTSLAERVLWIACNDFAEHDKGAPNGASGASVFVLE